MTDSSSPFGTYQLKGLPKILYELCRRLGSDWLSLRFAFIIRKFVLRLFSTTIIDAEVEGLKFRFYPLDNVSDRAYLFMPQIFDVKEQAFIKTVLSSDSTFLDVGGNSGYYSLFASRQIKEGKILVFEPHPQMVERLTYNVQINNLEELITVYDYGLADKNEAFAMSINPTNLGGNSIALTHEDKRDYLSETINVRCRKLLDVLLEAKIKRIDLLKIDIEEAEHLALVPFFDESPKSLFPKHIIIESDEKIDFASYGYQKIFSTKSNHIYQLKSNG